MNKQLRVAGLVFVLGLVLGLGIWQQQGLAAGQAGGGLKQAGNKLKRLFSPAAVSKSFSPASRSASTAASAPAAPMATITVTSLGDGAANAANCPGVNCRLRDAIAKAVAGDTINFSVTGTITLTSPVFAGNPLVINKNLTITGPGAAQLTVSGNDVTNVLVINSGVTAAISGLTIAGAIDNAIENGGGIRNAGNLTLTNCTLSDNQARQTIPPFAWRDGGAIYNTGTLTVTGSTLSNNFANQGGGIFNSGSLTITGTTTLSSNSALNVGGAIYNSGTLTITASTLSNNQATSTGGGIFHTGAGPVALTNSTLSGNYTIETGGGIYSNGTGMTVTNSTLSGNEAVADGGGMRNIGTVTFINSTLSNNRAPRGNGGGIDNSGTLTVTGGTLSGNSASDQGGGIRNLATLTVTGGMLSSNSASYGGAIHNIGTLTITASTFSGNDGLGGGGLSHNAAGPASVANCTFSGNQAHSGGGIDNRGTGITVTNCTLSGNEAGYRGGGIRNTNILTLINSTLSGNQATTEFGGGYGGGISNEGILNARNTLVAGNTAAVSRPDVEGSLTSQGYNLIGNNSGATITPTTGDQIGTAAAPINPLLAPLANYGGPTHTHALLPGSPAINAGTNCVLTNNCASNNLGFNLTTDQRGAGFNRQAVSAVDIGAFESRGFTLAILSGNNQSASPSTAFVSPLRVTVTASGAGEPVTGGRVTFTSPGSGASAVVVGSPATISGSTATSGTVTANAIVGGPYNVAASSTGAASVNFSLTNINVPPTITAGAALSRQRGSAGTVSTIAMVSDGQTPVGSLVVTATTVPAGITVTSITNSAGTIMANVAASCTATIAANTVVLTVTDGNSGTATANLTVNVTSNTAPTLSYAAAAVSAGSATTNSPTTATDNGSISSFAVQSQGTYTGTISVNASGVVSISNASPAGNHTITIRSTDNCGSTTGATFMLTVSNAGGGSGLQFYPLAHPVRLLDTRPGQTGCDAPGAMIAGQTSRTQTAAGRTCDGLTIPANAQALTGNITTVESGGGFLTLYPSDITRPLVANSNFAANQVLNNVFTVGLGAGDGAFNIYVTTNTNVVVDITGYYAPPSASGLYFHPLPHPVRLLDTRSGQTACFTPGAPLAAGSTMSQIGTTTCDGVLIPAGAQALVGNATTVAPQSNGFLTLFPADASKPPTASSNFQAGINMNAPFTVGLSPSGEFNIYTAVTTDLVVDVLGYFSTQLNDANGQGLLFNSLPTPVRLLDTRAGQSGCFTPGAQMVGGTTYLQQATGACTGIPAIAKAVVGNATTINVAANGFLTFWPSDANQPNVATSNYRSGQIFNRHFTAGFGSDGAFKRFAVTTTDLIVDISGYFAP